MRNARHWVSVAVSAVAFSIVTGASGQTLPTTGLSGPYNRVAPSEAELRAAPDPAGPKGRQVDATTQPANEPWVQRALHGATHPSTTQAATGPATTQASTSPATTQAATAPTTTQAAVTQPSTAPATTQATSAQDAANAATQAAQAAQAAAQAAQVASQTATQAAVQAAAQAAAQAAQAASQAAQAASQAAQAAQAAARALQGSPVTQPATTQVVVTTTQSSPATTEASTQSTTTQATTASTTTQSTTTQASTSTSPSTTQSADSRFFHGLLDHRSLYGQNWFPQPLAGPSLDANNQLYFLYSHQEDGQQVDQPSVGIQSRFEMLTLTLQADYVRLHQASPPKGHDATQTGISTFDIGVQHPLYQYVSQDGKFDSTFGARALVGIPSGSDVGQDGRFEFDLWELIRLGDHWAVQLNVGYNEYFGPNLGGETSIPWTAMAAYRFERNQWNLPGVTETWLMAEIEGDGQLASTSGGNPIFGIVGGWMDFKPISHYQPRLGVGVTFPLDGAARHQEDWGVVANFLILF